MVYRRSRFAEHLWAGAFGSAGHESGAIAADPVPPFDDCFAGDPVRGKGPELRPSLEHSVYGAERPCFRPGRDVGAVFYTAPVDGDQLADRRPAGRNARYGLTSPLDLRALVGETYLGDGPNVGLEVDPLLLASHGEAPVEPTARHVP